MLQGEGLPAKYLQELTIAAELGDDAQALADRIESGRRVLAQSVSMRWNIDQFTLPRDLVRVIPVIDTRTSTIDIQSGLPDIGRYVADTLAASERIEVDTDILLAPTGAPSISAVAESDYYLVMRFSENEHGVSIEGTLRVAGSGHEIGTYRAIYSGFDRWQRAAQHIARRVDQSIPIRGRLIARRNQNGVINIGGAHGITTGMRLQIIRGGSLRVAEDRPAFLYESDRVVGAITITAVDDLVAEGELQPDGLIDQFSIGDAVVVGGSTESIRAPDARVLPLYNYIRQF